MHNFQGEFNGIPGGRELPKQCSETYCVDKGATAGADGDGELGPQAVSRKAGYAGPGPRGGSFHGPSRRSGPGTWPLPARPSRRRRRQARRSQGGHSRDHAWPTEQSWHGPLKRSRQK